MLLTKKGNSKPVSYEDEIELVGECPFSLTLDIIHTIDCDCVNIEISDKNIIVHMSPNYVDYEEFFSEFEEALDIIAKEKNSGFIRGDFDIDIKYDHNH